ncbi:hypothetical protein DFH08DRAFT_953890 [Mycena albidolilacea]|uniref:Uncharacterized protein n=1 Tax=Mycena albidolilacea TaxID=1033008 RepID=A0AAD7EXD7_9AGAR|nr:hypothetical protein DFH08DRAFT_953890 [Mycena albidolilacea]
MATDSVELRSSVYYLTCALARLQKRLSNRLATLFTRVLPDEKNTAVALMTGMVPDQVDAWIIRESEADSPTSSMESSSQTESPPNRPDLIISKNSEMTKGGQLWTGSIDPGTSRELEQQVHEYADPDVAYRTTFDKYVPDLLTALRVAAVLRLNPDIDRAAKAQGSLYHFAVPAIMVTDSVELRSSVYYLTCTLARLQKKTSYVNGNTPTASRRPDGPLRAGNRLETLFIRGLPEDKNTVVAPMTGMALNPVDAWIILGSSSVTGENPSSQAESSSPDSSKTSETVEGQLWKGSIDAETSPKNSFLLSIIRHNYADPDFAYEVMFDKYVPDLLTAVRVAAALRLNPDTERANKAQRSLSCFVFIYNSGDGNDEKWAAAHVKAWGDELINTLRLIGRAVKDDDKIFGLVSLSELVHEMLRVTPPSLWKCFSLDAHVHSSVVHERNNGKSGKDDDYDEQASTSESASTTTPIPVGIAKRCCLACAILAQLVGKTHLIDVMGKHARWYPWVPPCGCDGATSSPTSTIRESLEDDKHGVAAKELRNF